MKIYDIILLKNIKISWDKRSAIMKKAVRNLFIILITFCVSIVYLFGCQKADNSTDGPNIMDLPNQETGMQISLDEYKKRVENIFNDWNT